MTAEGLLFVLSGPSGVGKDAVLEGLANKGVRVGRVVTAVTRPRRKGEKDGVDYYFMTLDEFATLREGHGLIESADYVSSPRGTPLFSLRQTLARGDDAILKIDVDGFRQIKSRFPDAISIFLSPPSLEELERRLRARGDESDAEIERRIARARDEIIASAEYDHVIVNERDGIDDAIARVAEIITLARRDGGDRRIVLDP